MSDTTISRRYNRRGHRRSSDPPVFRHHHYRRGSEISSYTAVNGAEKHVGGTTHFKSCKPTKDKDKTKTKRIELVFKQGPPVYTTQQPPVYVRPFSYPPQTYQQPYDEQSHHRREPVYVRPPPARRYETYKPHSTTRRYETYQAPPPRPPKENERKNIVMVDEGTDEQKFIKHYDPQPINRPVVTEGTGKSMLTIDAQTINEGTNTLPTAYSKTSTAVVASAPKKDQATVGTGGSMLLEDDAVEPVGPKSILKPQTDQTEVQTSMYFDAYIEPTPAPPTTTTTAIPADLEILLKDREPDLCPLCHKGWYVRKFTWSGIIAAIFCFPCGIAACFKMRIFVCSFCGEQPVAQFTNYKEEDMEKREVNEGSDSRVIPPQLSSHWGEIKTKK